MAIAIAVDIGSAYESEDQAGISHILEHMAFRGTEKRSGDELQQAFGLSGGYLNAVTDEDSTVYQGMVLHQDVDHAVALMCEMVSQPRLNAEDLELEKKIVERESCRGCPNCTLRETMYDQAFPEHPLSQPIIGFEDTVASLSIDDLRAHHRTNYVGENITVSVCGNVDHTKLVAIVDRELGHLPMGQPSVLAPLNYAAGELHIGHSGDEGTLRLIFPMHAFTTRDKLVAELYYDIIGGHGYSLFMNTLREDRGLVYDAWSECYTVVGQSLVAFEATGEARNMPEITDLMISTLCDFAKHPTAQELDRAKQRQFAAMHMSLDRPTSRVDHMRYDLAETGALQNFQEISDTYQSVTLEDLSRVAQMLLSQPVTIVSAGPTRGKPKFQRIRAALRGEETGGALQGLLGPLKRAS